MKLNIKNVDGKFLVDSREVAEMTGKDHSNLMRDIRGYCSILENSDLNSQDFFLPSTYKTEGNNKTYDCYLLTRKGCDMVANKMTGEKGVLFTAAYVTRFEEMEKQKFQLPQSKIEALEAYLLEMKRSERLESEKLMLEQRVKEYEPKVSYLDTILQSKDSITVTQIAKDYGLTGYELNKMLHEEKIQYKMNKQWLLYRNHQDKGYTKSTTWDVHHTDGTTSVKMNTRWTQKGRLFIHETLGARGIVPYMDREQSKEA